MSSREHWWTWYVSGYKGRKIISAKAIDGEQAEYLADLFRRDGVTKIRVHNDAQR
jgi:hypothetical protein